MKEEADRRGCEIRYQPGPTNRGKDRFAVERDSMPYIYEESCEVGKAEGLDG